MKLIYRLLVLVLIVAHCAAAADYPFQVGEKMKFTVYALGMKAGFGEMKVARNKNINGTDCYQLVTTIESNPLFGSFFYISDRVDCYVDKETLLPLKYKKTEVEGDHSDKYTVYYNHEKNLARKDDEKALRMKPNSSDQLSTFYYLRTLEMEPGTQYKLPNCDGEKNRTFNVEIVRREKVTTELGTFDAIVVDVTLDEAALIFAGKAKATLWMRDDDSRMILKLSSSFILGEIKAEITSVETGSN